MTLRIGSVGTFLLLLIVLGAEGLIGAAATISWTVPNAFIMGLLVGVYLALAVVFIWRDVNARGRLGF